MRYNTNVTCLSKVRFCTIDAVKQFCFDKPSLGYYECDDCKHWHTTTKHSEFRYEEIYHAVMDKRHTIVRCGNIGWIVFPLKTQDNNKRYFFARYSNSFFYKQGDKRGIKNFDMSAIPYTKENIDKMSAPENELKTKYHIMEKSLPNNYYDATQDGIVRRITNNSISEHVKLYIEKIQRDKAYEAEQLQRKRDDKAQKSEHYRAREEANRITKNIDN